MVRWSWKRLKSIGKQPSLNEPPHDKTNKVTVRPAKTQISLGILPVWSESSLSAWRKLGSLATHWVHSEECSDWADAQADLSVRWAHSHVVGFVMSRLKYFSPFRSCFTFKWCVTIYCRRNMTCWLPILLPRQVNGTKLVTCRRQDTNFINTRPPSLEFTIHACNPETFLVSNCRFGVSPVNYPDPDVGSVTSNIRWNGCMKVLSSGIKFFLLYGAIKESFPQFIVITKWAATWQNKQTYLCVQRWLWSDWADDSDQPWHPPSLIRVFAVCSLGS